MSGNTFGELFRVTTFGESHGPGLGVVVDGVPAGIRIDEALIQRDLDRRRPGQSRVGTARREADMVEILSGVFEGVSTGTPIGMIIRNNDQRSQDYGKLAELFRPGHADLTFFRFRDPVKIIVKIEFVFPVSALKLQSQTVPHFLRVLSVKIY